MWLIFGPAAILILLALLRLPPSGQPFLWSVFAFAFGCPLLVLFVLILWKYTARYLDNKKGSDERSPGRK